MRPVLRLGRRLAALLVGAAELSFAGRALGGDARPHLEVVRAGEAADCPDAPRLAADVARAVGHDALDVEPEQLPGPRFDVVFARLETGYTATIRRDGREATARTLAAASCAGLRDAVEVALALMLDDVDPVVRIAVPPPPDFPVYAPEPSDRAHARAPDALPTRKHWYGWQTLLFDASGALFLIPAVTTSNEVSGYSLWGVAVSSYLLGPPMVHVAHGRWKYAFADFGVRVGSVATLASIGAAIGSGFEPPAQNPPCWQTAAGCPVSQGSSGIDPTLLGAIIGGALGVATGAAIDAGAFARERVPVVPDSAGSEAISWAPSVLPTAHGASAGVVGRF